MAPAESEGSRCGKTYMSTGGEKLPNHDKKLLEVVTNGGVQEREQRLHLGHDDDDVFF